MGEPRFVFFASGRSDLSPLLPVIEQATRRGVASVVVTDGPTLDAAQGSYRATIASTGATVESFDAAPRDDSADELLSRAMRCGTAVGNALSRHRPAFLVLIGDRHELLPVAAACVLHGVPIAHISGGEITEGVIDDAIRHAVSKLAALHFCASADAADRLRSLGEEPWRILVTGDPGIDRLLGDVERASGDVEIRCGIPRQRPRALLTFHPATLSPDLGQEQLEAVLAGMAAVATVVATYPAPERGSGRILERLQQWAREREGVILVETLGLDYPAVLATSDLVVGNSSSGIIEAPSLAVPVVNVGDRQKGRPRWPGIIDVVADAAEVARAVKRCLSPAFRAAVAQEPNPFGDGHAAERIVDALVDPPGGELLRKRFIDARERH